MSEIELPEATARVRRWTTNSVTVDIPPHLLAGLSDGDALYTAEQVREVYTAALMEAAKMCDEAPYLGKEAADCADIIRARAAAIRRGSV